LVPKKANDFISVIAEELELDEEFIDIIVTCYWQEVRKTMSDLKGNRINVLNFGIFESKKWKLQKLRDRCIMLLEKKPENITFLRYAMIKETETRLERVQSLLDQKEADKVKKQKIKDLRNAQKDKDHLEKPQGDISGNQE
jgi:hypothetical protein